MSEYELRDRTKQFALRVVRMFSALPKTDEARVLGKHCYGRERVLRQTIAKLRAREVMPNYSRSWG
jgi:hypothetical protein